MISFFSESSNFVIPVILLFIAVIITWSVKFYQLYIKKDYALKHHKFSMSLIYYLAVAILLLGFSGYFIEYYFNGPNTSFLGPLFVIIVTDARQLIPFVDHSIKSSSLMMICMLAILITGLLWFPIKQKINAIGQAKTESL
jgi:hypothetical protein